MVSRRAKTAKSSGTILCFLLIGFAGGTVFASPAPFTVVIDPGHGGLDHGAIYDNGLQRVAEKEITLRIAVQAARALREKGFNVTLTRSGDTEVPLSARTALANRLKADVFLSIHMNSTREPRIARAAGGAEGVETFILNHTSDATSKRLAYLENSANRPNLPQVGAPGAEPTSDGMDVALILKDLTLDANTSESKRLACSIQNHLVATQPPSFSSFRSISTRPIRLPRNRGVREAMFHVLLGADMPSALVEAGFLTSARDRAAALSVEGRKRIGNAIAEAIEQYHLQKDSPQASLALSSCKLH